MQTSLGALNIPKKVVAVSDLPQHQKKKVYYKQYKRVVGRHNVKELRESKVLGMHRDRPYEHTQKRGALNIHNTEEK